MVLRSRKIRVQDFHTNLCEKHVHTSYCGVRRISSTGLGEIIQNIAWELDVLRVIAGNSYSGDYESKKCACAVRLRLVSWQPRHSSPAVVRNFDYIGAEVLQDQLRNTYIAKVTKQLEGSDSHVGEELCHGAHRYIVKGNHLHRDIYYLCVSQACGCVVTSGFDPGPIPMATSSSMTTGNDPSVFEVKRRARMDLSVKISSGW